MMFIRQSRKPDMREIEQIPSMEANVTDESAIKSLTKLITSLEDNDDVQKVYFNCDLDLE